MKKKMWCKMMFNKPTDKRLLFTYKKCFSCVRSSNVILKSNECNNCTSWKTERRIT